MPTWPYIQNKKLPSDLNNIPNGKLNPISLASLSREAISTKTWDHYGHTGIPGRYPTWTGHKLAVAAMELMIKAAAVDKIDLRVTGCYRDYSQQENMWNQRYTDKRPNEKTWNKQAAVARKGHRKLDEYSKIRNGKRHWLRNGGGDPSAIPGESNHGLGIAFDLEFGLDKYAAAQKAIEWVRKNGFAFGFYWDTGSTGDAGFEQWHLTYCFGDDYGCLPLIGGSSNIIPAPPSTLKPTPASKKVGKAAIITKPTPNSGNNWRWWVPQELDWFDVNKAPTFIPFNGFPVNPPSALKP